MQTTIWSVWATPSGELEISKVDSDQAANIEEMADQFPNLIYFEAELVTE